MTLGHHRARTGDQHAAKAFGIGQGIAIGHIADFHITHVNTGGDPNPIGKATLAF